MESFEPRFLEYRYKQAVDLIGEVVTQDGLRELTGKDEKQKSSYHLKYSPKEIRVAREKLHPQVFKNLQGRDLPAVICVHTSKGGTGKTTTASNVAVGLAAQGFKVALIDADPQASATTLFGFPSEDENRLTLRDMLNHNKKPEDVAIPIYENAYLDFFPADLRMGRLDRELSAARARDLVFTEYLQAHKESWRKYEYIIIDTNPSSTTLNFNMMVPANLIIAVALLDGLSITALNTLGADIHDIGRLTGNAPQVMLVPNGYHPSVSHIGDNLALLREQYATAMSRTTIPSYAGFGRQVRIGGEKRPLVEGEASSPGAQAMISLSREIAEIFQPAEDSKAKVKAA